MMTTDQMGWLAFIIIILGVGVAVAGYTAAGWVLVLAGVGLIIFAKTRG